MGNSSLTFLPISTTLLLVLSLFHISNSTFPSNFTRPQLCHDYERSALLQFKDNFLIDPQASYSDPLAYPKVESWTRHVENSSDCCLWDGVECDDGTGHVIGLDLSSSYLYGSIDSNSSLFRLVHLRKLNLALNYFNYSLVPPGIGHLSELQYLNLSASFFSGQIPSNVSALSKLSSLDLSSNDHLLALKKPDFKSLIQNLTSLEFLHLNFVDISSTVPDILENSSSLVSLQLRDCGLYGKFPTRILQLPKLKILRLSDNPNLNGQIPEIHLSSPLRRLLLANTSFSGELPATIGNFNSLNRLAISFCNFSGRFPSSLRNMTQLEIMYLDSNPFNAQTTSSLSWLGQLTKLTTLSLTSVNLYGEIPSFANLTQLSYLYLDSNQLTGSIPSWLMNQTQLFGLELSINRLHGPIPMSISKLQNLEVLGLGSNNFSGRFPSSLRNMTQLKIMGLDQNPFTAQPTSSLSWLGQLTKLVTLGLTSVNLFGEIPSSFANLTQLSDLYLDSNRLDGSIPSWLMNQTRLVVLALSWNRLQGPIPMSISNLENLELLSLSYNNFSGAVEIDLFLKLSRLIQLDLSGNSLSLLEKASSNATSGNFYYIALASCNLSVFPDFLRHQDKLLYLELSYNNIRGQIPNWLLNLSDTLKVIDLTDNLLTGEISPSICKLRSLHVLRAADNKLSGMLPSCLGDFSTSVELLDLGRNNFHGTIPQTYTKGCNLRMIAFDHNRLSGEVPRSLANCSSLEFLNLGSNRISGVFPSWLGALSNLKVLILSSNKLLGVLEGHGTMDEFQNLHVIDLSQNNFSGQLPIQYFHKWKGIKTVKPNEATYMQTTVSTTVSTGITLSVFYSYTMLITNKGIKLQYDKITELLAAIDLSCNRFEGDIPKAIGELKGLRLLNLSNNLLTGHIPPSLGDLADLEALDLSRNELSGRIPQELVLLNFLSAFNVSHNHLSGAVPQGKQFDSFLNNSYEGNPNLCGKMLPRKCAKLEALPPASSSSGGDEDSGSLPGFGWKPVLVGYGCGLIIGLVIGHVVFRRKYDWFMKALRMRPDWFVQTLRIRPPRMRKSEQRRRRHRN